MGESGGMEKLPKNKELEAAMLCVNGREFLSRLDWVRKNLGEDTHAWEFLTKLAYKNPAGFVSLVSELSNNLFEWDKIDKILLQGTDAGKKIRAIKAYREYAGGGAVGLKEAKEAVEDRMRVLQVGI